MARRGVCLLLAEKEGGERRVLVERGCRVYCNKRTGRKVKEGQNKPSEA